jgi:hypothetical protein
MISVAAEMAIDLQWPLDLDLTVAMGRLEETFKSCFDIPSRRIRDGTTHRAIKCGRAYCSLRLIDQADNQNKPNPTFRPNTPIQNESDDPVQFAQLLNVVRIMNGWPDLVHAPDAPLALPWGLHVIPSLKLENRLGILEHFLDQFPAEKIPEINASTFTAYLCCVHSFLAPIKPAIIAQMDKRQVKKYPDDHLI